ncbi:MAG TPA: nuclear transport factor 2 family protein [Rhodanobacteraceae bacterium]|nr:nuclear transport factor 2 family protein [Rhodanobacteraceae bacterium]
MRPIVAWLVVLGALGAAEAQEPVVAAKDPEALFTDADPAKHANKQVVLHILRELVQCNHWEQADRWLTERYLQHNPNVTSGRDNVVAYFADQPRAATCDTLTMPIVTVLTSGDIVGVVFRMQYDDPRNEGQKYTSIWYDQWRIVDGRADEHWDTATLGPPVTAQ